MAAILNTFSPKESYLRNVSISHLKDLIYIYIYTRAGGEGDEVSIEEPARGWWCLKILADCHHPDALPLSAHPLLLVETCMYIYIHTYTSLTSEGNRIPLSCCSHTFVYPA